MNFPKYTNLAPIRPIGMTTYRYTVLLIALVILSCKFEPKQELPEESSWINRDKQQGLTQVETEYPFELWVSNDSLPLPQETLSRLEGAKHYMDSLFGMDLDFAVILLENKVWDSIAYFPPPGMPQAWEGNLILGAEHSVLARSVEAQLQNLPPSALSPLQDAYGDPSNMDGFYREILAVHELAHLYHFKEATKPQRRWLQELFANMAMFAYISSHRPEDMKAMSTLPWITIQWGREPQYTALSDFEEKYLPGLGPQNYEWFQMNLYMLAERLIKEEGPAVVNRLHEFLVTTDLSRNNKMTDAELAKDLKEKVSPMLSEIYKDWHRYTISHTMVDNELMMKKGL